MTIESFHRLLIVVHLDSKHNRRIDHLLSVLVKIGLGYKACERLIKHEKGKKSHQISETKKRHHARLDLLEEEINIDKLIDVKWQVPSQSQGDSTYYTVERILDK